MKFNSTNLKRFLNSHSVFSLIFDNYQCGWLDGGCYILARAIVIAIPKARIATIEQGKTVHHYLAEIDGAFIDADGISSKDKLISRWIKYESLRSPVVKIDGKSIKDTGEVPNDEQISKILSLLIKDKFQ